MAFLDGESSHRLRSSKSVLNTEHQKSRRSSLSIPLSNPTIHELTVKLVQDEIVQIVSAVRRRLGPLGLDSCWHGVVDRMRPLVEPDRMARQVRDLAGWLLSRSPRTTTNGDKATRSGQMLSQLATYLYFATTVLDVFSETHFDRTAAHATRGSCGSFEYLAEAGREIGVSHDSSLNMLSRFRIT